MHVYMYMYACIYVSVYVYIYIYICSLEQPAPVRVEDAPPYDNSFYVTIISII